MKTSPKRKSTPQKRPAAKHVDRCDHDVDKTSQACSQRSAEHFKEWAAGTGDEDLENKSAEVERAKCKRAHEARVAASRGAIEIIKDSGIQSLQVPDGFCRMILFCNCK